MSDTSERAPRLSPFAHAVSAPHQLLKRWFQRIRHRADENPYSLALKIELTWLSPTQRSQLDALVPPPRNPLPKNVVEFRSYFPDRTPRQPESDEPALPNQQRWHWPTAGVAALAVLAVASV